MIAQYEPSKNAVSDRLVEGVCAVDATQRDVERALLIAHLQERDTACPACGHNVRGIASPVCPECGTELAVSLCRARERIGPWLLGLVVSAAGLGFSGVMTGAGMIAAVRGIAWTSADARHLLALGAAAALSALTLTVLLRRRSRIANRPRSEQWCRAAVTCGWIAIVQSAAIVCVHT